MKAESLDGADQPGQRAAAAAPQPALGFERVLQQFADPRAGSWHPGTPRRAPTPAWAAAPGEILVGRRKPRVHAGDGAPVGLIGARRIHVAAASASSMTGPGHRCQFAGNRQLRAQRIQLLQIVGQQRLSGAAQRQAQGVRGDMRIAVAVAADPAAQPQETRRPLARAGAPSAHRAPAGPAEKISRKIGERGVDFIGDIQPFTPQRPRLPQQRDLARDRLLDRVHPRRSRRARRRAGASAPRCDCDDRACSCASPRWDAPSAPARSARDPAAPRPAAGVDTLCAPGSSRPMPACCPSRLSTPCRSSARLASIENSMKLRTKATVSSSDKVSSLPRARAGWRCRGSGPRRRPGWLRCDPNSASPPWVRITSPSSFPRKRTSAFWVIAGGCRDIGGPYRSRPCAGSQNAAECPCSISVILQARPQAAD